MNLIEKIGYRKSREVLDEYINNTLTPSQMGAKYGVWPFTIQILKDDLLRYRREHGIFEVGDKVIKTHPKNTILWPVLGVYKNGGVWLDYKGFCWKPPSVRHATDEEIKVNKRLEVD